jgi:recombination protein RecA
MAPPFKEAEFDIMYGEGISRGRRPVDVGVKADIIDKSGSWYSYNGERIGQGRENVKKFFQDNPDLFDAIDVKVREAVGLLPADTGSEAPTEKKTKKKSDKK